MNRKMALAIAALLFAVLPAAAQQFTLTATPVCHASPPPARPAVRLAWTELPEGASYDVFRDGLIFAQNLQETTIDDVSPDVGNPHSYHVVGRDFENNSKTSNTVTASAPAGICPPPPGAFTLSGTAACDTSTTPFQPKVNLAWSASSGATRYDIIRSGESIDTTTSTSFSDLGVAAGNTYNYRIRASNAGGETESNSITVPVGASVCGTPPGPFVISTSASCSGTSPKVTVSWTTSNAATAYFIVRDGEVFATLPETARTFEDPVPINAMHTYSVRATNSVGSAETATESVIVPPDICSNGSLPTAPALSGSVSCNATTPSVVLTWSGAANATTYNVVRDGATYVTGLSAATTTYTDVGVGNGQTHSYIVRAVNAAGTASSNVVSLQIQCSAPPSAPVLSSTQFCGENGVPVIRLTWTAATNAASYNVYRDDAPFGFTLSSTTLSFDDSTVLSGQTHIYRVRATNGNATTDSNSITVTAAACGGPPSLSVIAVCTNSSPVMRLSWSAPTPGAGYTVLRNNFSIGTTSATTFDDTNVTTGQNYTYVVRVSAGAPAIDSNSVSATAPSCTVSHADLGVNSVVLSKTSAIAGDAMSVSYNIVNVGNGPATTSVARVRIGTGPEVQANDVVVATVNVASIPAGATVPVTTSFTVPAIPAGTYFIFVSADDDHTVDDQNGFNNTNRSGSLQVSGVATCTLTCADSVPAKGNVLQSVSFALQAPPACPNSTILWTFGDSATSSAFAPAHIYEHPGTYFWTMALSAGAQSCQRSGTIEIAPLPTRRRGARH